MTELALQKYLRSSPPDRRQDALKGLDQSYGVSHRRHKDYPNLITFKYRSISADFSEQLVCESRGIILDEANNWNVVARAFDKFFNYGEARAAEIDWSTAKVFEKYDGTLCLMYHYDDKWHVGTTGTPDGSGTVPFGGSMTFAELFWQTFEEQGLSTEWASRDITFIFELVSPLNRVVVRYPKNDLYLIGARSKVLGEVPADTHRAWGAHLGYSVKIAETHPLGDWGDGHPLPSTPLTPRNPLEHEGYVIRDDNFNRVKVKDPAYVALHHLAGGISRRRVIELVMANESEEVLSAFPEYKPQIDEVRRTLGWLRTKINYDTALTRKVMAEAAKMTTNPAAVFSLITGKYKNVDEYLRSLRVQQLEQLLDKSLVTPPDDEAQ